MDFVCSMLTQDCFMCVDVHKSSNLVTHIDIGFGKEEISVVSSFLKTVGSSGRGSRYYRLDSLWDQLKRAVSQGGRKLGWYLAGSTGPGTTGQFRIFPELRFFLLEGYCMSERISGSWVGTWPVVPAPGTTAHFRAWLSSSGYRF
jgi:hypothetical protein